MSTPIFNLSKDNPTFDLSKDSGLTDTMIAGLSWKTKGFSDLDLDLSVVAADADGNKVETASFKNARRDLLSGAMYHFGDDLTGSDAQTDVDNEQVRLRLDKMPPNVHAVWVMGAVYSGSLSFLKECSISIRDGDQNKVLSGTMEHLDSKAIMLARIVRSGSDWKVERIDGAMNARTVSEALPYIYANKSFSDSTAHSEFSSIDQDTRSELSSIDQEPKRSWLGRLFGG